MQGTLKTRYDSSHFIRDVKEEMLSKGMSESCLGKVNLAFDLYISVLVRSSIGMSTFSIVGMYMCIIVCVSITVFDCLM